MGITQFKKRSLHILQIASIFFGLMILIGCEPAETSSDDAIVFSNESFEKKIHASTTKPAPIEVTYHDADQVLIAKTTQDLPYFELFLNQQLVSSNDPIWVQKKVSQRAMQNGGTEYSLSFLGAKAPVKGLEVLILQQVFPGSTLMREQLQLKATENYTAQLNKREGKLHFKFPQYHFVSASEFKSEVTEFRLASWELKPITFNYPEPQAAKSQKKYNHMYYPDVSTQELKNNQTTSLKGPISILAGQTHSWLTCYEHASQDDLNGIVDSPTSNASTEALNDALQGTKGVFDFPKNDDDFRFIDIQYLRQGKGIDLSIDYHRGAYLDGEVIDAEHPYQSVWSATAFYPGQSIEEGKSIIRHYLLSQICERPASRKPEFYYNTWGMQREVDSKGEADLRGVLTYERIFEEIEYAAELGVDIFVLDDGWEQMQGEWRPHRQRLPQGLAPIKQKLDELGIKMGVWFSPAGIDSTAQRYQEHPEWVILDTEDNPIKAQWGHPAFDMVSDFLDVFVEDCKQLIDEGALFFKWDAINTFYSSLPNLDHGSDQYSAQELRERYAYLLPIYITKAMEALTEYEPELIIEIDLTEARRVMMGLAPLSQGKLFFMNNGASGYNDYSPYRAMSMRTIPNEWAGIIPLELFTYANYPHNLENSMVYNVHTSLISGHGFWGNLQLMSTEERLKVGEIVKQSKRVLPYLTAINTVIRGKVGDDLETYTQVNPEASAGQVLVFNRVPYVLEKKVKVDTSRFLAVLGQAYQILSDSILINFEDNKTWSSQAAFILPKQSQAAFVQSSTCSLSNVEAQAGTLEYTASEQGQQVIKWRQSQGEPQISADQAIKQTIEKAGPFLIIKINTFEKTRIQITVQ